MDRTTAAHVIRWIRQRRDYQRHLETHALNAADDLLFGIRAESYEMAARQFRANLYRQRPTLPTLIVQPKRR